MQTHCFIFLPCFFSLFCLFEWLEVNSPVSLSSCLVRLGFHRAAGDAQYSCSWGLGGDYLCRRAAEAKSEWNVIGYRSTNFSWHRLLLRLIPLQCRLPGWKYCRLFYGLTLLVGISHISAWMVHFCSVSQNRNSSPARWKEFLGGSSLFELEVVPELSLNRAVPRWKVESQ